MPRKIIISLFLVILSLSQTFTQNTIVFDTKDDLILVANKMSFLPNPNGNLTVKDILKPEIQKSFLPYPAPILYSAPLNCMWLKFKVKNNSNKDLWIDLVHALPQELDFYVFNQKGKLIHTIKSGYARPKKNKPNISSHYVIPINRHDEIKEHTFYVRIYNKFPVIYIPKLGSQESIISSARNYDYRAAIYLGLMLVMILYNSFIGYITKERVYLYYVLFLVYIAYIVPYQVGDLSIHSIWFNDLAPVIGLCGYLFPTLFAFRYLEMKKRAYKFYLVIAILTVLLISVSLFYGLGIFTYTNYINYLSWLSLLYNPILWAVGVYLWIKGNKNARFYTIAWTSALGVSLFNFLIILGLVSFGDYVVNVIYVGFSMQVILFAIALGDRMNILQKEKREIQQENLHLVEKQKEILEQKVKERTIELQETNEELQVMNEELQQSQEELSTQRDSLDVQNVKLNSQQKQIRSSIKAAKSIQQAVLPYQEKLDTLLKDYFIINRPKDVVSGDFYWVAKIDNKIMLIVADCTGHGVPGAFMTLIGSNLLDKIICIDKITDPAKILTLLHEDIQSLLRQQETNNNSGMDAIVLSLLPKGKSYELTFSGAKNELWYFEPKDYEINVIRGARKSIGGYQNDNKFFENTVINLPKNSLIYAGSDGLHDQNNKKRISFGKERLQDLLTKIKELSLEKQKERILEELNVYMQKTEQRDDILCIGFKL